MRTVETIAQLDDLPVGTAIRGRDGSVYMLRSRSKRGGRTVTSWWEEVGVEGSTVSSTIPLPARVLDIPGEDGS